jgi:hypothetical protein
MLPFPLAFVATFRAWPEFVENIDNFALHLPPVLDVVFA